MKDTTFEPTAASGAAVPDRRFAEIDTFVLFNVTPAPDEAVQETFNRLPDDQYLKGPYAFRKRAFARGRLSPEGIAWDSRTDFFQSRCINEYAGDIERVFAPADAEIRNYIWRTLQCPSYRRGLGDAEYDFGLHQLRILCDATYQGFPVPEGYHQDGFDFVSIHSFQRFNVNGGRSYLRAGATDGPRIHEHDLLHGEVLVFNDRRLFHYASPISCREPGPGHRDICVLTFACVR